MAYTRPTLTELIDDLRDAFRVAFVAAGRPLEAFVRNTVPWVLTRAWGDALHNLYGLLDYGHRQILPLTADTEWLDKHADTLGLSRLAASAASGSLLFVGLNGTVIPSGTALVRTDGVQYVTTEVGVVLGVSVFVTAVCSTAGAIGNGEAGLRLSLVAPIVGITTIELSSLGGGWTDGADIETDEALRERLLLRLQRPPQGGSETDYDQWARLVVGVTKVWIHPLGRGAGTVDVYFLHSGGTGIGIPTTGQVADVQAALDPRRPLTADVLALAPTEVDVDFTLEIAPDTTANRAAIEAELDALFLLKAGSGESIYLSDYWSAVTAPIGAGLASVSMTAPAATTTVAVGEVAVRGAITWV
jgi:uncharacterized phage protein gp47/JayE